MGGVDKQKVMVYSESVKRSVKRTLNNKGGNKMLTINPVNMNSKRYVSFGEGNMNNINSKVGVMSLDKKPSAKINFEKDMYITQKADSVQSNPLKAIGYNIVKAYNILVTPRRRDAQTESKYIHIPYMA